MDISNTTRSVFAGFLYLLVIAPTAGEAAANVDDLTYEQAQQVADNFQALRDSLDQGKEEIADLEQKFEQIKQNSKWLNDSKHGKELQQVIDKLEKSGLNRKLQATHQALDTISNSANKINATAGQIKARYDKVKEFHERWHPDKHNPVRPLELVANGLAELESVIQKIDPSPDNILTKPITAFIGYYKSASQAFAGALARVQEQIEERRQNCLGVSCENYSEKGTAFSGKFHGIGPAWLYRPISDGEIWYDGDGMAFLWWKNSWHELQGGISLFEEVYHGWHLAHGQIITTSNLVARMNSNYASVAEAKKRAGKYWLMLNSSNACHSEVLAELEKQNNSREAILSAADHDREKFVARYMFLQEARSSVDRLVNAFINTILVKGVVMDENGKSVEGARINVASPAGTTATASGSGGWFTLRFNLKPDDSSRQNAAVSVSHQDYAPAQSEQRLWNKCENWQITLRSSEEDAGGDLVADMQSIRQSALAESTRIEGLCQNMDGKLNTIDTQLDNIDSGNKDAPLSARAQQDLHQLLQQARQIARESDEQAKSLAESSKRLGAHVKTVCNKTDLLQSARGPQEKKELFQEIQSAQRLSEKDFSPLQTGFARLDTLAREANQLKSRANTSGNIGAASADTPPDTEQLEQIRSPLSGIVETAQEAEAGKEELESARTRAALIVSKAKQQSSTETVTELEGMFAGITRARDRASACTGKIAGRLQSVTARIRNLKSGAGTVADNESPGTKAVEQEQIDSLVEEAVNNRMIAERFFSLEEMESRLEEGKSCLVLAEKAMREKEQDGLLVALDNCDLDLAEQELHRSSDVDPAVIRRYEELKRREEIVIFEMQRANGLYQECQFSRAQEVLENAAGKGVCEKTMDKLMRGILVTQEADRKYAAAEQAYNQADNYYRQRNYQAAYRQLQKARQDAVCTTQIDDIDNGLEQVAEKLQEQQGRRQPQTAGLECDPPREPGISNTTGQPACLCPGDLMWSKDRQQCLTFSQLMGGIMDDSGLSDTMEESMDLHRTTPD